MSARADREQNFFAQRILELLEIERRLTFVAQNLQHCRPALIRYFNAAVLEMHDVHLEGFDLKVPVVAAIWTSQRHLDSPTQHSWVGERLFSEHLILMKWSERTQKNSAQNGRPSQNPAKSDRF